PFSLFFHASRLHRDLHSFPTRRSSDLVIWQRDANSYALRSLEHCTTQPRILNVTGAEVLTVRETAAFFAQRFGKPARFTGIEGADRKSTRLNSSHLGISYAVFCLKKKI